MASAGLLLLLLVSSSLILSSLSAPSSSNQQGNLALQKRTDAKKVALTSAQYAERILTAAAPFFGIIPVGGALISALVNLAGVGLSIPGLLETDPSVPVKTDFENLNMKINRYHVEQKWDIWASAYHNHENNIEVAWNDFKALLKDLADSSKSNDVKKEKIEMRRNLFNEMYKNFVYETKLLRGLLTAGGETFMTDFEKLVADHFRCHEEENKKFTMLIHMLIYKGNTMNLYYYRSNNLDKVDELANIAFDLARVMFEIQKYCLSYPDNYIKLDVQDLIDENKNHQDLEKDIRLFLEKTHVRYDWIVFAFRAKNVKHHFIPNKKKNTLSGFIEVTRGQTTVAVARQVKGTHTQADKVSEEIKFCLSDKDKCEEVPDKLKGCGENAQNMIVYAFTGKMGDISSSTDAKEVNTRDDDDNDDVSRIPDTSPYFYKGKCAKKHIGHGRFIVLIQSDEEIDPTKLCKDKNCGEKGKCKVLENTAIAVCECKKPYYGEDCEESLDDYKKKMNEKMPKN